MIPVIALIGRPNVGKSTLFNRLTHTNNALVANFPGITRDRKYGFAKIEDKEFICIDTGGIYKIKHDILENRISAQSMIAIKEADIILFIVDASIGLMPEDFTIAKHLHLIKKPTFLVVNKIDGIDINHLLSDFWSLGLGKIYPIAALSGYGLNDLFKTVILSLVNQFHSLEGINKYTTSDVRYKRYHNSKRDERETIIAHDLPINLAIVGCPNVGKSTLINYILGEERMIVCNSPGTTRDSIYIPMQWKEQKYVLIDTAGVRKRSKINNIIEKFSVTRTLQAIKSANVVLLVIDAKRGITDQDLSLLSLIIKSGRSLVIALNKWDILNNESRRYIENILCYRIGFIHLIRIHFISALNGSGVNNIFISVREAYNNSTRHYSASMLTRVMNAASKDYQPPLVHGRRVKLKYAHIGGYNPLIIVIHGNQVKNLPVSYKRYLLNYFRKSLDIIGTFVRIQLKEGENPFTNHKHNTI